MTTDLAPPPAHEQDEATALAPVPVPSQEQALATVGTDISVLRDHSVRTTLDQLVALRANAAQRLRRLQKEAAETAAFLDTLKTFGMRREAQKHLLRLYKAIRDETALLRDLAHDVLETARALGEDIGLPNDDAPSAAQATVDGKSVPVTEGGFKRSRG